MMTRRLFSQATTGAGILAAWPASWAAAAFPTGPIQVIVPYAAGGADSYIRPLQPVLAKHHGISLVIESVVGAGGTLGTARVKRSKPDGQTLLFCGSGALTIAPRLQPGAPLRSDFIPLLNLVTIPYFIATKKGSPIQDMRGLLDFIKSRPGMLSYGSPGFGSAPHLGMEALARSLGSRVTHIPFSGIATAMQSLLGGHIDAVIGAPSSVMPQVDADTVTALAVVSTKRFPLAPDVPSVREAGIDIDVSTHFAFHAPKGTPPQATDRLAQMLSEAAADPAFRMALEASRTQMDVVPGGELVRLLAEEEARFAPMLAGMRT